MDEKQQFVPLNALQRSRNIDDNSQTVIVNHYTDEWRQPGWIQIRSTATHRLFGRPADHQNKSREHPIVEAIKPTGRD